MRKWLASECAPSGMGSWADWLYSLPDFLFPTGFAMETDAAGITESVRRLDLKINGDRLRCTIHSRHVDWRGAGVFNGVEWAATLSIEK